MTTPLTAYLRGFHAGLASIGISANPFVRGSDESNEWMRGYFEGHSK